jgi:Glycosyltransferase family 9 (heptosyltransferase)/Macrocin-O-methyltransferase (TylF)
MPARPCRDSHPDPDVTHVTCRLCKLAITDGRYQRLWGLAVTATDGPHNVPRSPPAVRVNFCASRNCWDWAVTHNGRTIASGTEKSEAAARAEAAAAMPEVITLNMGAGGIGDGLLGLLAAAAVRRDNSTTHVEYRCGAGALPFVALFDAYDELSLHDWDSDGDKPMAGTDRQLNTGYLEELRTRSQRSRIDRYCHHAGTTRPVVPPLRAPERVRSLGADLAGCVVLAPFTNYSDREWPLPHWFELERLLLGAGYRAVVLDANPERIAPFAGVKLAGQSAERVAGVLANAAAFVGNDSGMTHLAGILGTSTIALCGTTTGAKIFGAYPSVWSIDGPLACSGCYWQEGHRGDACRPRCPSIAAIPPAQVLAAIDALVLPAIAGNRSLVNFDRLAVIRNLVLETNRLAGDVAELGVYQGGTAKLIRHYAAGTLHLFDTFAGIPTDDADGKHLAGEFPGNLAEVQALVPNATYHVGSFPATAPDDGTRYRFVHLDADTYQSTAAGLDYFAPRMVVGGVIVLDDYGWWKCPGVGRALHERFSEKRIERTVVPQAAVRF